ncbi:MAG: Ig-like domain-containing protein, partial [Bacteroidales bacterium]|nr:Ig-like domain-containing protein [Bacteroidales bacterium]
APIPVIKNAPATANEPFDITIDFGEEVTGFKLSDLKITNCSVSNLKTSHNTQYTLKVTPLSSGDVTIDLPANRVKDLSGNNNQAATGVTVSIDLIAPTLVIAVTNSIINDTVDVTFTFSEVVTGFEINDIAVTNCNLVGGLHTINDKVFTSQIQPIATGAIEIGVAKNVATDNLGNGNSASSLKLMADVDAPQVEITTANDSVIGDFNINIQFTEEVVGFTQDSLKVTNGMVSEFDTISDQQYTATILPTATGTVVIEVPEGAVSDLAGNEILAYSKSIYTDITAPVAVITSKASGTVYGPFNITIDFKEKVIGFKESLINVTNGHVKSGSLSTSDSASFTATIIPDKDGIIDVIINPNE